MTLWNGSFPFYPGASECFPFDTTQAVIASVFLSILATFIIILPGIRGRGQLFWFLRVVMGLFVGAVVLRNPVNQVNETINYNEHFAWSFKADYDRSYGEGLEKGLPSPILYVAEKFTTQSPCSMHMQYRISSHYTSLTLWMAFCTWLISILLFSMPILLYGGCMLLLTAVLMLSSLLFFTARNTLKCPILFGPASLNTDYGGSFWLTLATGLLCLLLGLGVIILNSMQPEKLKLVFNLDKGKEEEEERWDKSCLPAEPSSSAQDVLMVPLGELCEVTATQL
uniref:Dual oxidase maturation factor 1 n=1 Tax=Strix occidentalis caurina TaxID=311401 RepID=A0A8D0KQ09_STROC